MSDKKPDEKTPFSHGPSKAGSDDARFSLPDLESDHELKALLKRWQVPEPAEAPDDRVLARYRREVRPASWWIRFVRRLSGAKATPAGARAWKRAWVGTAAMLTAVVIILHVDPPPSASAAGLLGASRQAENGLLATPGNVIHRVLSLEERRGSSLLARRRVEIWRSRSRPLAPELFEVRRAYDASGTVLAGGWLKASGEQTIYRRGFAPGVQSASSSAVTLNIDNVWQLEPSAETFATLIGNPGRATVEERPTSYVIHFRRPAGADSGASPTLLAASITLLKPHLRAVEQTLLVGGPGGEREYRLSEASLRRVAAADVAPTVLQPDAGLLPRTPALPKSLLPRPTPRRLSAAALTGREVEAFRLLHEAGELLGAQVSVKRTPRGGMEVDAIAESQESKARLLDALKPLVPTANVRVRVETVAEALRRQKPGPPDAVLVRDVEIHRDEIPVYVALHAHFSRRVGETHDPATGEAEIEAQIRSFADRVVDTSRDALLHALALRRLEERFPPAKLQALNPEAFGHWRAMVQDYARGFRERTEALRLELQSVFLSEGGARDTSGDQPGEGAGEIKNPRELAQGIERLCQQALANDETIRSAFALSTSSSRAVVIPREAFGKALRASEALARGLEGPR